MNSGVVQSVLEGTYHGDFCFTVVGRATDFSGLNISLSALSMLPFLLYMLKAGLAFAVCCAL